jgi:multimeric flavodoxin WrbA
LACFREIFVDPEPPATIEWNRRFVLPVFLSWEKRGMADSDLTGYCGLYYRHREQGAHGGCWLKTMKNILGVIGSPRKKGNTEKMVSRILEGAHDLGAHTETIRLGDLKILECDGCHACWKGRGACSKKDDMAALYPKIAQSDAIVFGTPVYWYGPTAIMKCFVDRFVYFNCPAHREQVRNKAAVIAIPFEDRTYATADLLVGFFERSLAYLEMRLIDRMLAPGVTRRGEVSGRKRIMATCYKVGRTLASSGDVPLKPLEV